ncbi:MAG: ABC transporter ATP-binding protein [Deltaproteobacteria bacterium]|nr:ABC transporter ATP-binding protein [Deltaproteobacteria bacterium]
MPPFLRTNQAFVFHFLKPYLPSALLGTLLSILLGVCSTGLATLVGPSLRLLVSYDAKTEVSFVELFGARIAPFLEKLSTLNSISTERILSVLPLLLVIVAGAKFLVSTFQYFVWESLSELLARDIRLFVTKHFLSLHASSRRGREHKEKETMLSSAVTTDVKLLREYLVHFYGSLARELLQVLFLGITLLLLSPRLFAWFFLGALPAVAIVRQLGRKLQKRAGHALQDYSQLTEWLQQRLLGIETIKHYSTEDLESQKFTALTSQMLDKFYRAVRVKARTSPLLEFTGIGAMVLVLVIALVDIKNGVMTGAVAVSFFTGLAILAQSGGNIGRYLNSNREGAAATDRIRKVLATEGAAKQTLIERESSLISGNTRLVLENVRARYPGETNDALRGISLKCENGKIYCIQGPSGSGKSTLFNVILGSLLPYEGQVIFHPSVTKNKIGYLPQDPLLFHGSVAANVTYPDREVDEDKLKLSLEAVELWDFVEGLPQGFHTLVGGKGREVSGGQVQRLHLARLLYHSYLLILIDEGTSALDPENERLVCKTLSRQAKAGAVVLMISHREMPVQFADEVLHLSYLGHLGHLGQGGGLEETAQLVPPRADS